MGSNTNVAFFYQQISSCLVEGVTVRGSQTTRTLNVLGVLTGLDGDRGED